MIGFGGSSPPGIIRIVGKYRTFAQLRQKEAEGRDYVIRSRAGHSGILVIAPHGGGIEPGTGDLADALAGRQHAFYCFKGIKKEGNRVLHITSNRFDEPLATTMLQEARWVLALHGCRDVEVVVWVGGRDFRQGDQIIARLQQDGFPAHRCDRPGLRGLHPDNICNRGHYKAGVQLEISYGLRNRMFANLYKRSIRGRTPIFHRFVHTLATAMEAYGAAVGNPS